MNDLRYRMASWMLLVLLVGGVPEAHAQSADSTYVVRQGDTLYSIAQRVGASVRALQSWNDLDGTAIAIGDTLRVRPRAARANNTRTNDRGASPRPDNTAPLADSLPPVEPARPAPDTAHQAPPPTETPPPPESEAAPADTARTPPEAAVAAWDAVARPAQATWIDLALRTGIPADSLWRRNDAPERLPDRIRVPTRTIERTTHTVARGETLYSLAGRYGVSVRALEAANNLEATNLQVGQTLRIPTQAPALSASWSAPDTAQVAAFPAAFAGRLTASGVNYDPEALVGSHPTLPYHSVVLVSHPVDASREDARHVFVRVIDRSVNGPEVSAAAAEVLGLQGTQPAALRVVWRAPQ